MIVLGYLALSAAIIVLAQVFIYRAMGYKNIVYTRRYSPTAVVEGETVEMTEKITNAKLLPLPWLRVESQLDPNLRYVAAKKQGEGEEGRYVYGEHNSIFSLPPYSSITRKYTMLCEKRGYYALRLANLSCQDVFGLGEVKSAEVPIDTAVTVYPRILPFEELGDLSKNLMGDVIVRRWIAEDPFMLRGVREYTPSDAQNRINWKASARTGNLMVHEYDYTADIRLMVYFNIDIDEFWRNDPDPRAVEEGISKAGSVIQFAIENGIETGFASNAKSGYSEEAREPFGTGKAHLAALFTQLAALKRQSVLAMSTFLEYEVKSGISDAGILLMTGYIDEKMEKYIDELRAMGNLVEVLLLDRYTKLAPPDDGARFRAKEGVSAS